MISIKQWMDAVGYRITEGSPYMWDCYGENAHCIDSWNGDQDGHSSSVIFDTVTQVVYETTVCDYANQRAYRLVNPDYVDSLRKESDTRNAPYAEAWDDIEYVDLTVDVDFLEKLSAIHNGLPYDDRVQIELDLTESQQLALMRQAHAADLTLNEYIAHLLTKLINEQEGSQK